MKTKGYELLASHGNEFGPIVPFNPVTDRLVSLDFTANNTRLTADVLNNTNAFSNYINEELKRAHALYGIGGYGEHRTIYDRSRVFDPPTPGEEPRRLHLGVDVWGKPHTGIRCPYDAIVHSFAFNNQFGDYGATIILSHHLEGFSFHTLYGHLSLSSLKNLQEGRVIRKGDVFAEFGIPAENGQWPPHLHFQVVLDMKEWKGDYPGVCRYSEREQWLANSPDPDLLLQLNRFLTA